VTNRSDKYIGGKELLKSDAEAAGAIRTSPELVGILSGRCLDCSTSRN